MPSSDRDRAADPDRTLDRIRKLLAKAERAATAEEADTYNQKAAELMARHGVDAALLAATGEVTDSVDRRDVAVEDPYSAGKARSLAWIAGALRTRAALHQQRGGRVNAVTLVGFSADLRRVEVLYTSLLPQATAELVRLRPASHRESVTGYRRSWLHGFAVAVHQRLSTAEQHAEQERADPDRGDGVPRPAWRWFSPTGECWWTRRSVRHSPGWAGRDGRS
jgi:hypothetical protein